MFWSGAKKPPSPLTFDINDSAHIEFITSVAFLRAKVYQISVISEQKDLQYITHILSQVIVPEFRPVEGLKIAANDEELKEQSNNSSSSSASSSSSELERRCQDFINALPLVTQLKSANFIIQPIEFDKDIDEHMLVVAATSNLRARNYRIPEADLHVSRGIAGKIIPAIATTTAMVTGAICLELMKVLQGKPRDQLFNFFANLAIPIFTSETPEPPKATVAKIPSRSFEWRWTTWDCIDVTGPNLTVQGLIDWLEEQYGLELSMLSSGVTILFSDFMPPKKRNVMFY
jgi:ubiquitin-activating enzyme E1